MSDSSWDQTRFNQVLDEYMKWTSRDMVSAINTKAWFITRGAIRLTMKASGKEIRGLKTAPTERRIRQPSDKGLLVGAMINKRRGPGGGLYGKPMKAAIHSLLARRMSGIALLKSGWLEPLRKLAPLADRRGAPPTGPPPRMRGAPKGSALEATEGMVRAIIENRAASQTDKGLFEQIGGAALREAFDLEAASMEQYIIDKMAKRIAGTNSKL